MYANASWKTYLLIKHSTSCCSHRNSGTIAFGVCDWTQIELYDFQGCQLGRRTLQANLYVWVHVTRRARNKNKTSNSISKDKWELGSPPPGIQTD